jgi:hypothetical protein
MPNPRINHGAMSKNSPPVTLPKNLMLQSDDALEGFETIGDWTAAGSGSIAADAVNVKEGSNSLKITTPVAGTETATKTISMAGLGKYEFFGLWVYMDWATWANASWTFYISSTTDFSKSFNFNFGADGYKKRGGWMLARCPLSEMTNTGGESWGNTMIRIRITLASSSGVVVASFDGLVGGYKRIPVMLTRHDGIYSSVYTSGAFALHKQLGIRGDMYVDCNRVRDGDAGRLTLAQLFELYNAGWGICSYGQTMMTATNLGMGDIDETHQEYGLGYQQQYIRNVMGMPGSERYFAFTGGGSVYSNSDSAVAMVAAGTLTGSGSYGYTNSLYMPPGNLYDIEMTIAGARTAAQLIAMTDYAILHGQIMMVNFDRLDVGGSATSADYKLWIADIYQKWRQGKIYPIIIDELYRLMSGPVTIKGAEPSQFQVASSWTPSATICNITHEAGDFSEYEETSTDSGNLAITVPAGLNSTGHGMAVTLPGGTTTAKWAKKYFGLYNNETDISFRIWIDPNSMTIAAGHVTIAGLIESTTGYLGLSLQLLYSSGYQLKMLYYNDSGAETGATAWPIADMPHVIECHLTRASAAGVSDGVAKIYIDHVKKETVSNIANFALFNKLNRFALGAIASVNSGDSGTYYLDEAVVTRNGNMIEPVTYLINVNFESGDFTQSSSQHLDSGDVTVAAGAALNGTGYGMNVLINDTAEKDIIVSGLGSSTGKARIRFYFDPNTLTMANLDKFYICYLYDIAGSTSLAYLEFRISGGVYMVSATAMDNSAGYQQTSWYNITDAPHYIEIYLQSGSGTSGSIELLIDGISKQVKTLFANDTRFASWGSVVLGAISGIDAGTSGTVYFDELVGNDTGVAIGA